MKKLFYLLFCLILSGVFSLDILAYTGHYELAQGRYYMGLNYRPEGEHKGLYEYEDILYSYTATGEYIDKYTGWVKTEKGNRRYYIGGVKCRGWRKLDNNWYYFNKSNGNMVTGTQSISNQTYIFNDNGTWSGKRNKSSKRPDDFSITLIIYGPASMRKYELDIVNKALNYCNEKPEHTLTNTHEMSISDIQVFYNMVLDSGIINIKEKVTAYHIINNNLLTGYEKPVADNEDEADPDDPAEYTYYWEDTIIYQINITMHGKEYTISGDDTSFLYINQDKVVMNFCQFIWFIYDYNLT